MRENRKSRDPVTVRGALLQALIEGPAFGLELVDRVSERTDGKMKIGQGSLYPTLWSMVKEGMLICHEGEPLPERGGRPRKYYELTAEGLRQARQEQRIIKSLADFSPEAATT